jgi:hypothetical protein
MQRTAKMTVEAYLSAKGIEPRGYLARSIRKNHTWELAFIASAIDRLRHLPNLEEKIRELAAIELGTTQAESRYQNARAEFIGIWHVAENLGFYVAEIESRSNKIVSPYSTRGRSCDIRATHESGDYYFEAKESSAETLSLVPITGEKHGRRFDPVHPKQLRRWIESQIKICSEKGANFCIARVPSLGPIDCDVFSDEWLGDVFPSRKRISVQEWLVETSKVIPGFFEGAYLIWEKQCLLLRFSPRFEPAERVLAGPQNRVARSAI